YILSNIYGPFPLRDDYDFPNRSKLSWCDGLCLKNTGEIFETIFQHAEICQCLIGDCICQRRCVAVINKIIKLKNYHVIKYFDDEKEIMFTFTCMTHHH